jgi:hypothetical protein
VLHRSVCAPLSEQLLLLACRLFGEELPHPADQVLRCLPGTCRGVDCLAYSASSSSTLLSSGRDGQVCSLDTVQGSKQGQFKGSKHAVTAAALSAGEASAAVCGIGRWHCCCWWHSQHLLHRPCVHCWGLSCLACLFGSRPDVYAVYSCVLLCCHVALQH